MSGKPRPQLRFFQWVTSALQVCKAARAALRADRAVQKVEETVERRKAGDKLAVPNPLDLIARK